MIGNEAKFKMPWAHTVLIRSDEEPDSEAVFNVLSFNAHDANYTSIQQAVTLPAQIQAYINDTMISSYHNDIYLSVVETSDRSQIRLFAKYNSILGSRWLTTFDRDSWAIWLACLDPLVEAFHAHANSASIHYAGGLDETGAADRDKQSALEIFDKHPELEARFRIVAKSQLWSLERERPRA